MKNVSLSSHQELEERVKELIAELSNNHEVIWHLRANPKFLGDDEWNRLEEVVNKIYKEHTPVIAIVIALSVWRKLNVPKERTLWGM